MVQRHVVEIANTTDGTAVRYPLKSWIRDNRADLNTAELTSHQIRSVLKREGWQMRSTPTEVVLTPPGSPSLDSSTDDAANFDEAELDGSGASYFSLEAQLRDFLAANIKSIPINGKALSIYIDQTGRDGVEYPCAVGFMDILAVDDEGAFYVFELKRGRSPDYVLGQVARYMGWLKTTIGKNAPVYGVIVSKEISSNLKFARLVAENIYLYEYDVSFSLRTAHDVGH